jgi:hypothetical protein
LRSTLALWQAIASLSSKPEQLGKQAYSTINARSDRVETEMAAGDSPKSAAALDEMAPESSIPPRWARLVELGLKTKGKER